MDLQLPQRTAPGRLSFNTETGALTAWLNDLPLIDTGRCLELLNDALQQINTLALPPQKRRATLELLTAPVMCTTQALNKKFLGKPLPLQGKNLAYATQTLELCNRMATGSRILVEDLHGNKAERQQLAIALHQALRCLSEILLTSYRIYIQYPEGLWKTINTLYALADEHKLTEQTVTDTTLQPPADTTIATIYKQILLLSLACPYRLRQNEIQFVHGTLQDWADSSQLHRMDDADKHGLFSIDLQADAPPAYRVLNEEGQPNSQLRILDTKNISGHASNMLAENPGSGDADIMQRLMLAWGVMPKRKFARHLQEAPVKLAIGLNTIHRLALGSASAETELETAANDNIQDQHYLQDPTFDASTRISTRPSSGGQQQTNKGNPFNGAYAADKMASSRVESWKIADISAGGYCLLWDSNEVSCAQVGELVALIEGEQTDPDKWQMGTIRRMIFTEERGLELGIELLSPGARAVWARPCKNGVSTGDRMQGILLPGIEAIRQQASLLLPSLLFHSGSTATIEDNDKTESTTLTRQLENTGSYAQYHFTSG